MARVIELFEAIRPEVMARLIDGRATLKLGLGAHAPDVLRAELDGILDRMVAYLADPDSARYRSYISRWVAYHLGEGFAPEDVVHSVVTVGDVLCLVARSRLATDSGTLQLIRDLTRMNHAMARLVVDVLAGELARLDGVERRAVKR